MSEEKAKLLRQFIIRHQGLASSNLTDLPVTGADVFMAVKRMGAIQIDSINVIERSQYLTIWSRLGNYDKKLLDNLTFGEVPQLFEYWFHCACLIPLDIYPYRLQKMLTYARAEDQYSEAWLKKEENIALMDEMLRYVTEHGAVDSLHFKEARPAGGWWNRKPTKEALEQLYNRGELMISGRKNFNRIYDLKSRKLPKWVNNNLPDKLVTEQYLLSYSAKSLGIFYIEELPDYIYMAKTKAKEVIGSLIKDETIVLVDKVFSHQKDLYIHKDNVNSFNEFIDSQLTSDTKTTFLSPFDCLFWNKKRNKDILKFEHVFEAYKKSEDRKWGYYNMPILYNNNLIGRIDPKADRQNKCLIIKSIFFEDNFSISDDFLDSFVTALWSLANFTNCTSIDLETNYGNSHSAAIKRHIDTL